MSDPIDRQAAIDALEKEKPTPFVNKDGSIDPFGAGRQNQWYRDGIAIMNLPSAQQWIPCKERLPEEDHWLGGSGRQFSEIVMVTIVNHSDEDTWVDMTQTINGEWACELPKYCEIVAWRPLPEPWKGEHV